MLKRKIFLYFHIFNKRLLNSKYLRSIYQNLPNSDASKKRSRTFDVKEK